MKPYPTFFAYDKSVAFFFSCEMAINISQVQSAKVLLPDKFELGKACVLLEFLM